MSKMHITAQQVLIIAGVAGADPRTVKSFMEGGRTRPSLVARIEKALAELGVVSPRSYAVATAAPQDINPST